MHFSCLFQKATCMQSQITMQDANTIMRHSKFADIEGPQIFIISNYAPWYFISQKINVFFTQ